MRFFFVITMTRLGSDSLLSAHLTDCLFLQNNDEQLGFILAANSEETPKDSNNSKKCCFRKSSPGDSATSSLQAADPGNGSKQSATTQDILAVRQAMSTPWWTQVRVTRRVVY
jgi:hypothetical protein